MIFSIRFLLAYITQFMVLEPGDVVTTGTPGGVGAFRTPPEFMKPGDVVTVAVEGVGELTNPLVAGWVCDKDSSVSEQLKANPDTAHIPIHYDPGHIKKNFQKSLMAI